MIIYSNAKRVRIEAKSYNFDTAELEELSRIIYISSIEEVWIDINEVYF